MLNNVSVITNNWRNCELQLLQLFTSMLDININIIVILV